MPPTMVILVPELTSYAKVRHMSVSLPRIDQLIADQPEKYLLPESIVRPAPPVRSDSIGHDEHLANRRRAYRMSKQKDAKPPRAPSLRSLVKLALKCDSAEQMGKKLKERWEKQHPKKRGIDAEIDEIFNGR